jgi:hypothetical protein
MCAMPSRSRVARCCGVKAGLAPTLAKTVRARSVTRPFSSPLASLSNVPPGGFGVSFVTLASTKAREL